MKVDISLKKKKNDDGRCNKIITSANYTQRNGHISQELTRVTVKNQRIATDQRGEESPTQEDVNVSIDKT